MEEKKSGATNDPEYVKFVGDFNAILVAELEEMRHELNAIKAELAEVKAEQRAMR